MERMRGTGFLLELALGILMAVRTNLYAKDACFTYFDKPITVSTYTDEHHLTDEG